MSVVYISLPVTLLMVVAGLIAFIWSARSGQLDDLTTPALRRLVDDDDTVDDRGNGLDDPDDVRSGSSRS
jgi:cbb3-type cytochrome oxidase maturation protein